MRFLVTGSAGFIGFHLCRRLLDEGHEVTGLDGFTPYYDVRLKERRHALLEARNGFRGHRVMLEDRAGLAGVFEEGRVDVLVHLAAQAGVRYSLQEPRAYVDSNLTGTFNIMELARQHRPGHFMFASTSSVYGANVKTPFAESDRADHPITLYAATKKAAELMTHAYAHLWGLPTTAFRFFSVYGPWGRPDMAFFKFTKGILEGTPIDVYNHGDMARDFTYIDDLIEGIMRLAALPPELSGPGVSPAAPHRVVNIGRGKPERLMDFIAAIEAAAGRKALCNFLPMQPGDSPVTFADTALLKEITGFQPATSISAGTAEFVRWYRAYHTAAAPDPAR